MIIKINDDRGFETQTLYSGYLEENNSLTLEFEIPEYLEKYNKKANFELKEGTKVCKLFDEITSNKLTLTRDLLKFNKLQMAIEFFDTEENLIYRTSILTIIISDSIICDDDVSPEDSKVVILNELIQKVNELNTEITENESERESNEQTRISNEDTRVANETARQEYVTQLKKDVELGNFDGATFTPQINENGDLSWSNNKGLVNPQTINIRGPEGKEGKKGEQGEPFRISKTYPSVEAMQSDFENMPIDSYVMIATSIEIEDNAKLYYRAETEWVYITDFSGAVGIQGPKGDDGDTGAKGEQGNPGVGISKLEVIDGALYVTLTNDVKENAGVILTDEVKAWLVSQITDNAESDFNEYYNSKVNEFNSNATEKTTAYNDNAEDKLQKYNTNATNKISEYNSNADAILKLLPNKTTEIQETIDVDDAAEANFNELKVFGNDKQDSREGYNLFDYLNNIRNTSGNNITVEKDDKMGYIIVNGTPNVNYSIIVTNLNITDLIEDKQTYTLKQENANNSSINYIYSQIIIENKETLQKQYMDTRTTFNQTFTVDKTTYNYYANIQTGTIENTGILNNFKTRFMIYKGVEDKTFELFGASPSANYPQEIKRIKANINQFNTDSEKVNAFPTRNKEEEIGYTNSTHTVTYKNCMKVKKDQKYKLTFNRNEPSAEIVRIQYITDENDIILEKFNLSIQDATNEKLEFTSNYDGYLNLVLDKNATNIRIEEADAGIRFKRIKKNFAKYPYSATNQTASGLDYTIQDDLGIKITGTSIYNSNFNYYKDTDDERLRIKKGTYTISAKGLQEGFLLVIGGILKKDKTKIDSLVFDVNNTVKSLILEEDAELFSYLYCRENGYTFNTTVYLQIEKSTEATEYEPYHEDVYTLPVQQEMLALVEGLEDCFVKKDGQWYERHYSFVGELTEKNYNIDKPDSKLVIYNLNAYGFPSGVYNGKTKQYSNYFKFYNNCGSRATFMAGNNMWFSGFSEEEELRQFIQTKNAEGNPVKIAYIRGLENGSEIEPLDLLCTEEQTAILNQLEQFSLSKGINHIFSDDELSPKFKLMYYQDMNILLDKINKNIADVSAQLL